MLYVYIGCLTFSVLYSIVSFLFDAHGFDHGGNAGVDFSNGHGGGNSADAPSPFSPLVIASAITVFGAVGIITKLGFGIADIISLILALAFAGVIGVIIFFGIVKFMYSSQSNSAFFQEDLVGAEARVITPIPQDGMGEISYVINGMRHNMAARSENNQFIGMGEIVKIREVSNNTALVLRKLTVDDLDISGYEEKKLKKYEDMGNE